MERPNTRCALRIIYPGTFHALLSPKHNVCLILFKLELFSQGDALRVRIGLGPPGLPGDTVRHTAGTRPGGPGRARTRIVKDTNFPYKFEFTKYFISFQLLDGRLSVQLGVQDPLHHQRGAQLCLPGVDRLGAALQAERRRRGGTLCFQFGPLRCGQDGKGNWWVSLKKTSKFSNFERPLVLVHSRPGAPVRPPQPPGRLQA